MNPASSHTDGKTSSIYSLAMDELQLPLELFYSSRQVISSASGRIMVGKPNDYEATVEDTGGRINRLILVEVTPQSISTDLESLFRTMSSTKKFKYGENYSIIRDSHGREKMLCTFITKCHSSIKEIETFITSSQEDIKETNVKSWSFV